jgi:hypothetical protein
MRPSLTAAIASLVLAIACTGKAPPHARTVQASPRSSAPSAAPAQPADPKPEPTYDLATDQQRRIRAAKDELGGRPVVTSVVSDVFVVIGPPGWQGAQLDQSVALFKSAMAGYMNGRFTKKPEQAISVYLFPTKEAYQSFCTQKYAAPCISKYGFYDPGERNMVMHIGAGAGGLTHEIVHPLVEADFPQAPTWINEGIASLFEQPVIPRPGEIHGAKNWRHPRLKRALSSNERDKARLDVLFGMPDETFRDATEDLHYAMARYVCQWLDERGKLWPFYQKWRDSIATDPTGEKSFREVVGMTPTEASPVWMKWALAL